ncbi:transposase [Paracraurococcus lichenis]|uniref:Transposase n=1 Tax=Paracraurococcus lichenis TaxID=3064888 RepID=A0ABT9EAE5_9PROT|nr:transposase [Paracraurococcus sp. LOR1-02]MDO9713166.1 transposase [Paracraurococcus sp. LOR1-02]
MNGREHRGGWAAASDLDWLEITYPIAPDRAGSPEERFAALEQACLRRLEAIRWPNGPECPKCGGCDDAKQWSPARRRHGWQCRRQTCQARFHVLQAIPPLAKTHAPAQLLFRAMFLLGSAPALTASAFGRKIGMEQKNAGRMYKRVQRLRQEFPDLVQWVIEGPAAGRPAPKKSRRPVRPTKPKAHEIMDDATSFFRLFDGFGPDG